MKRPRNKFCIKDVINHFFYIVIFSKLLNRLCQECYLYLNNHLPQCYNTLNKFRSQIILPFTYLYSVHSYLKDKRSLLFLSFITSKFKSQNVMKLFNKREVQRNLNEVIKIRYAKNSNYNTRPNLNGLLCMRKIKGEQSVKT